MVKTKISIKLSTYCLIILLFITGCASFKTVIVSEKLNSRSYKHVGVLVVRVGNRYPSSPAAITLKTDYSIRIPKEQSTMGLSEDKIDVYIEDNKRLKESLPDYPNYKDVTLPKQKAKYFKNITKEIFITVENTLIKKGYKVSEIKKISKTWKKGIPEMTVNEIVSQCKGVVDAVFILHYMDVGDNYYNNLKYEVTSKGFSNIYYRVSMFDTATKERILYFAPSTARIANAIHNDPDNKANVDIYNKVIINQKFPGIKILGGMERIDEISYTLSDDEIIGYAMKYMQKGLTFKISDYKFKWEGLEEVIP